MTMLNNQVVNTVPKKSIQIAFFSGTRRSKKTTTGCTCCHIRKCHSAAIVLAQNRGWMAGEKQGVFMKDDQIPWNPRLEIAYCNICKKRF